MGESATARLLIVDDEKAHLDALCDILSAHGYETQGYTSGADALAALRTSRFDLLLADLNMPDMDGINLLRSALSLDPTLIGIIMTGDGSIATAIAAMKSGALDYVLKPFRLNMVLPVLSRAAQVKALRQKNAALEHEVHRRMEELATANRDLEAFSSSVSHDLRAPLRIVDGFSSILMSKHSHQLDEKGLHYLSRIRAGVADMNELVEGLLRLSHLGQAVVDRSEVDVARLVKEVLDELREGNFLLDDRVHVDAQLPAALADALLLRQVFANLLSNACKFTAHVQQPRVHVGHQVRDGESVYFVKDNGAGFDMAQAQRLFEPFQRLHTTEEFSGHGVGLSIVQRIVKLHGGRIWAEATAGEGACFYFSLAM